MKFVITGSLGNISKPLSVKLVKAGHEVKIISSSSDKIAAIEALGAKAAIGSVEDVEFLTGQFKGVDAVYTMVPPNMAASDLKAHIGKIGTNFSKAILAAGVKNVVNLSSIGAHLESGCGPVSGLYRSEHALNTLQGVNVVHLRAGFFYNNLFVNMGMIKNMGIMGSNYKVDTEMTLADTEDIATAAFEQLTTLSFKGSSVLYVVSDIKTNGEIAKALGSAIGKNDLNWVEFKDEDSLKAMVGMGLPEEIAKNYVEMGVAMRTGTMTKDYELKGSPISGKTKLGDFAKKFAAAYNH